MPAPKDFEAKKNALATTEERVAYQASTFLRQDKVDFVTDGVEMTGEIVTITEGKAEINTRFGTFFRPLNQLSYAK